MRYVWSRFNVNVEEDKEGPYSLLGAVFSNGPPVYVCQCPESATSNGWRASNYDTETLMGSPDSVEIEKGYCFTIESTRPSGAVTMKWQAPSSNYSNRELSFRDGTTITLTNCYVLTSEKVKGSAAGTVSNTSSGAYPVPTDAKKRRITKGTCAAGRIRVHTSVHTNCRNRLLFRRRVPRLPLPQEARRCTQCSPSPGLRSRGTQSARRGR